MAWTTSVVLDLELIGYLHKVFHSEAFGLL